MDIYIRPILLKKAIEAARSVLACHPPRVFVSGA
jgi:hypothetical protein